MLKSLILVLSIIFSVSCSLNSSKLSNDSDSISSGEQIEIPFTYKSLKILDLDQMTDILREKANDYKINNRIQALKEGALIAYSRPNEDVVLDKIISIVKTNLEDNGEWESCSLQIVRQSIAVLKDDNATAINQVTATIVLENVLSESKPAFVQQYQSSGFETQIIERIADADIKLSKNTEHEKQLNQMRAGGSPSQIARRLIEQKNKKLKEIEEQKSKK